MGGTVRNIVTIKGSDPLFFNVTGKAKVSETKKLNSFGKYFTEMWVVEQKKKV